MITAIVFVKADVARIPEVAEAIAALDGVSEVYSVTGEIDLIVLVRVRAHEDVADVVADRLNKVPGVTSTETHIAFRAYSRHDLEAAFSLTWPCTTRSPSPAARWSPSPSAATSRPCTSPPAEPSNDGPTPIRRLIGHSPWPVRATHPRVLLRVPSARPSVNRLS